MTPPTPRPEGRAARNASQEKLVAQQSGNRCAFPGCRRRLTTEIAEGAGEVNLGELAHIRGERPGAARHDGSISATERNSAGNLILLCREHHRIVDADPTRYTVESLEEMKRRHEEWVLNDLSEEASKLSFAELEVVLRRIASGEGTTGDSLVLTPPAQKIARNQLGRATESLIRTGMAGARVVENYLESMSEVDPRFVDQVVTRFKQEYDDLVQLGLTPDNIFTALHGFASRNSGEVSRSSAGLAVVVYLFERCEIFSP